MPAEEMDLWFKTRKPACIGGLSMRPLPNGKIKNAPLSIQRGQAEVFFLESLDGSHWVLKHFHRGRSIDGGYLDAVSRALPDVDGLRGGKARRVMASQDLLRARGFYYQAELAHWLEGTVLMPRTPGVDWAAVADDIRDGTLQLEPSRRVGFCRRLVELVLAMESHCCSHRDLSAANVFIDLKPSNVHLIDFDSVFHPTLIMPVATTCGTPGYTPPFAWRTGHTDPSLTWQLCSDRYALAILNVEFLLLDRGWPLTADGGMFNQNELSARGGPGVRRAIDALQAQYPEVVPLFETTLRSNRPDDCPSPDDWNCVYQRIAGYTTTALDEMETIDEAYFRDVLRRAQTSVPAWQPPRLDEMEFEPVEPLNRPRPVATLQEIPF